VTAIFQMMGWMEVGDADAALAKVDDTLDDNKDVNVRLQNQEELRRAEEEEARLHDEDATIESVLKHSDSKDHIKGKGNTCSQK
jgi:hypothetical protein